MDQGKPTGENTNKLEERFCSLESRLSQLLRDEDNKLPTEDNTLKNEDDILQNEDSTLQNGDNKCSNASENKQTLRDDNQVKNLLTSFHHVNHFHQIAAFGWSIITLS